MRMMPTTWSTVNAAAMPISMRRKPSQSESQFGTDRLLGDDPDDAGP